MKPIQVAIVGSSVANEGMIALLRAEADKLDHPIEIVESNAHVIRANDEPPLAHIDLRSDEPWKRERMSHGTAGRRRPSFLANGTIGSVCPPRRQLTTDEVKVIDDKRAAKEERRRKQREAAQAGQNRA